MINHLEGRLFEKSPIHAVIDCNGVGYFVNISLYTYSKLGSNEKCRLLTHLSIKEDGHTLFGFIDEAERTLFRQLISVSGVGPSTARMILSSLNPSEIQTAIVSGNVNVLKSIKGIGEKSAQRIIIDLKSKLEKTELPAGIAISFSSNNRNKEEALSALVNLGFAKNVAEKALEKAIKTAPDDQGVELLIKTALKNL